MVRIVIENFAQFRWLLAMGAFLSASPVRADLIPPGGEGVSECRNKKAGDACENMFIDDGGWRREPGTCVKAKLDHLPLKFKAHLRCVSTTAPGGSVSAPVPAGSVSAAAPAGSITAAAPIVSATVVPSLVEAPKSGGGCSLVDKPGEGIAFVFVALSLGVLARRRR